MIRRLLIYLVVFTLLVYGLRAFLYNGLRTNPGGVYQKYEVLFHQSNHYSTLLIGSSRMESHLVTSLFDSLTGSHSYNAGIQGATLRFTYTALQAYCLHSEVPKTVILELDPHVARYPTDTIFHFPRLFPYLSNPVLYKGCKSIDPRFRWFKGFAPYSLSYMGPGYVQASLNGWLGKEGHFDSLYHQGYTPLVLNQRRRNKGSYYNYIHPENRMYLDSIIGFCEQHQSRLILVVSPIHRHANQEVKNLQEVVGHYQQIANIHGLSLLNYSNDSIHLNDEWFSDDYHLFEPGARAYTLHFSQDFNNIHP